MIPAPAGPEAAEDRAGLIEESPARPRRDSHRTMLAAAKTFFRWCVMEKKWLARNPLDVVKGIGKVRHGKEQLRIDEARKWMVEAHGRRTRDRRARWRR